MAVIYGLFDPRKMELDDCRYVGQTIQPLADRLRFHIWEGRNGNRNHRTNWVLSVLREEFRPIIQIIEQCAEENLDERETFWIAEAKRRGWRLTNDPGKLGGDKVDPEYMLRAWWEWYENKPDQVAAMRAKQLEYWADPMNRELASETQKASWADPEKKAKRLALRNTPEHRQRRSEAMTKRYQDPEERQQTGRASAKALAMEDKTLMLCPEDDCDTISIGPRGLSIHMAHAHTNQTSMICECGAGPFPAQRHLAQHITKMHTQSSLPLMCECGKGLFKGTHGLAIHKTRFCKLDQ